MDTGAEPNMRGSRSLHRLETLSSPLMRALGRASPAERRATCLAACERAWTQTRPAAPAFLAAMENLRRGETVSDVARAALERETQAHDDRYLEDMDAPGTDPSEEEAALRHFAQARLGHALLHSFDPPSAEQAATVIYEALMATSEPRVWATFLASSLA